LGGAKIFVGALPSRAPRGYTAKVYYMNEIYTKLRHNLLSTGIYEIENNR